MSPRRLVQPGETGLFEMPAPQPRRRGLALVAAVGAAAVTAGLAGSAVVFAEAQATHQAEIRDAAVLSFVRSFITQFTSPDPFNANAYADGVLALGTGTFAELYSESMNDVVIQVARAEPGFGTVQEIGIERWNPDGSATVVAVANMSSKMPDGKKIESGSRWEVTAVKEGGQWKVSNLILVP